MILTDSIIKAAKPKDKSYSMPDGNGLALWILPSGVKSWRFRYRFNGKANMLSLGSYPIVLLKKARAEHMRLQELLAKNINPSIERQEQKQRVSITKENSFESVARL